MPRIGDYIRERLKANAEITRLCADRVTAVYVKQFVGETPPPALAYMRRSTRVEHDMQGGAGQAEGVWTVRVWTADFETGELLADEVLKALDGKRGAQANRPDIRRVFCVDRRDVPVEPEFGEGAPPFLTEVDFEIAYAEPVRTGT